MKKEITKKELIDLYKQLVQDYRILKHFLKENGSDMNTRIDYDKFKHLYPDYEIVIVD